MLCDLSGFFVKDGETTTVNIVNIQANLRVKELKNRNKGGSVNRTEFEHSKDIFIDSVLTGVVKEIYSS